MSLLSDFPCSNCGKWMNADKAKHTNECWIKMYEEQKDMAERDFLDANIKITLLKKGKTMKEVWEMLL